MKKGNLNDVKEQINLQKINILAETYLYDLVGQTSIIVWQIFQLQGDLTLFTLLREIIIIQKILHFLEI